MLGAVGKIIKAQVGRFEYGTAT